MKKTLNFSFHTPSNNRHNNQSQSNNTVMKAVKYLIMGALVFGLSAPAMAQDYTSVIGDVSKALKDDPQAVGAAKSVVKDYLKTYKKDPHAMVALGNAYLASKNFDKAVECADLAIKRNKNFGDAYILKGDVEAMKDDGGQAAMWYQQAISLDPKNPNGYMSYANVYRKRSPQESERVLNELRQNIPDYPIDAETGHVFYTSNNYEKAIEYFDKANISNMAEGRIGEYALSALSIGDYAKGLSVAKTAISRFPTNMGFVRLAMINGVLGKDYSEAVRFAEKLIGSNNEINSGDYNYYGQALAGINDHTKAIDMFTKSFSMDETSFKNLQSISECYTALGNEDKALEYSTTYLDKNPDAKPSEYSKLANIYIAKVLKLKEAAKDKNADASLTAEMDNNWNKAMGVFDNLITKYPHTGNYVKFQKGHQAYRCEKDDIALTHLTSLINELKDKSDLTEEEKGYLLNASSEVGYIYWGDKQDLDSAKPYYEIVYKLNPNDKTARQALGIEDQPAATE